MSENRENHLGKCDDAVASEVDRIVEACEKAWHRGERPDIDDALRGASGNVDRDVLLIELIHLELEQRLAGDESARVEEYLARYPLISDDRPAILGLIRAEYEMRRRGEPGLEIAEYNKRFPWCRELLPTALAAPPRPRPGRVAVRLNCPHCQNPIEIVDDRQNREDVICPSCGSSFKLAQDLTNTWKPEKLPRLGKFELLEAVGRGAFGTVYRARDTELDRIVAVKLPRSGSLATGEDEDRFFREARSIAQLRHANIVSIHETGRSEQFPYIVSEFVDGVTLADLLTGRRLGLRESTALIATVAEALEYAHQQGIIHRDVKPSNIMVDDEGQPHLMDFGLARRDAGEITMTIDGQVLGTPAYMSPEQARGEGHRVDGRGDVYSLGVILYELLTGELPFRGNTRMLLHQVLKDEPRALRSLNDRIPRDLETICLKAMAKEPARRYPSAGALAEDLQRYLSGQSIAARPVGRVERGWRWCRRNPVVAGLSAAVVAALVAGTTISAYFAIEAVRRAEDAVAQRTRADEKAAEAIAQKARANQKAVEAQASAEEAARASTRAMAEAKRAEQAEANATEDARRASVEAEKAQQVARFLSRMFEESAPLETGGLRFGITEAAAANAKLTAREILDRGAARVGTELKDQPVVQAALKDTMGNVYLGLGLMDEAESLLQEAFELRKKHLPSEHPDMASSLHSIGLLRSGQVRFKESASALREALAIRRKVLGEDHELVDTSRVALGTILGIFKPGGDTHDGPEAVSLMRETLAWRREHLGPAHPQTAFAMLGLAGSLLNGNKNRAEAPRLIVEATPILLKDPATKSLGLSLSQFQQAEIMKRLGQRDRVLDATRKGLASAREGLPDGHPFAPVALAFAVNNFIYCSKLDEAEQLCREWFAKQKALSAPETLFDAIGAELLTEVLVDKFTKSHAPQDLDDAEEFCRKYMSIRRRLEMSPSQHSMRLMQRVAEAIQSRDPHRAELLCRDAIEFSKEVLARRRESTTAETLENAGFAQALRALGSMLRDAGRMEEVETLYGESLAVTLQNQNEFASMWLTKDLADIKQERGRFEEAEKLYRESARLLDGVRRSWPMLEGEWTGKIMSGLGNCLAAQGRAPEAEEIFRRSLEITKRSLVRERDAKGEVLWRAEGFVITVRELGSMLQKNERGEEAEALYREALALAHKDWGAYYISRLNSGLGDIRRQASRLSEAEQAYREGLRWAELYRKQQPASGASWTGDLLCRLGNTLAAQGRRSDAEESYQQAVVLGDEKSAGHARAKLFELSNPIAWNVRFYQWQDAGPHKPPADWDAVMQSTPLSEITVEKIDFDWGDRAPGDKVPADFFATLARGDVECPAGKYKIETTSDDGVRVLIDGKPIIDNWKWHQAAVDAATVELSEGRHSIQVAYFEIDGAAVLKFSMQPVPAK